MAEGEEKRHAPTARRLAQAAERGDVKRSGDFPKAAVVGVMIVLALAGAAGIGGQVQAFCAVWLSQAGQVGPGAAAGWAVTLGLEIAPLLLLVAALGVAASLFSGGWVFSLALLKPDFSKLLPGHGLGQVFSAPGFAETGKALVKFAVIGGVGAAMIRARVPAFAALAASGAPGAGPVVALVLQVLGGTAVAVALLAGGDLGLQFFLHRRGLRMSDSEIREEMKEAAGNPQVRSRQKMLARKLARARQMRRIPEASVIVTNPTHFAVAIRYRRGVDRAPLLLAKGVGMLAAEIVSRGRGLGVPVVEAPPLARAVYRHVEPGEHVPVALYRACAEVLAYIWKMQRWRAQGGQRPVVPKVREGEIEV